MKQNITVSDVESMSYVEFISLLKETNRCPGGKESIRRILLNAHVDRQSHVLEIGANTGFTSLEIARVAKCRVHGIDVEKSAIEVARASLAEDIPSIQELVTFDVGSAYDIPAASDSYDLLVAGGATSFMDKKLTALNEYHRVLKPWGLLSITNLFYAEKPPQSVVDDVSRILGVQIPVYTKADWLNVFLNQDHFELYYQEEDRLEFVSDEHLDTYIQYFINKPHIQILSDEVKMAIAERWKKILKIFNENHKYLGFMLVLFRKRPIKEEPELFLRRKK